METLTLEQAYYIGELVASFVVLISLVYMAIQLRQNTNAIRLGTAHAVAEEFREMFALAASTGFEIATVWRTRSGWIPLDPKMMLTVGAKRVNETL